MANLFAEDSDLSEEESSFRTNNEYAKNYNNWRQKEEFNKLKTKYGEHSLELNESDESEDSSSDDDDDVEISKKFEVDFFKTLSSLKTKDPKIYDENVKFFDDAPIDIKTKKNEKIEKMFLKDYERKFLLEKGGILSDSENEENDIPRSRSPTYVDEQRNLKQNLHKVSENIEDDDESEWGGMFKIRSKTKEEKDHEESEYKQWLMGNIQHLNDLDTEKNLKPLKEYWNDPNLDQGEKFLRDYILNNRFSEKGNSDYVPTYDEIVHDSDNNLSEDESNLMKQEEFEHKYNYRFEEPDQDFIKRYPRTMENSVRRTDERRKLKRADVKERKIREKEEKFEEISKMKELKRKEIQERIEKLREVTGNSRVAFEDIDLEADFDAEEHDRKMQTLFDNEFYQGEEGDQKPEFPDMDEELEIERWDKWERNNESNEEHVHCEDENFNMDCEYDPAQSQKSAEDELMDNSKGGRKKRKRKSKFAKAVSQPKPIFDPNSRSFEDYLEEYYKFDCEDFIGNISCRFKYRNVVPNNFGLTVDEILQAKDRELNKWCSIKKAVQLRPDHIEKYDVIAYSNKGKNEALKRKILSSLFEKQDQTEGVENIRKTNVEDISENVSKKKFKKISRESIKNDTIIEKVNIEVTNFTTNQTKSERKRKKSVAKITENVSNNDQCINSFENRKKLKISKDKTINISNEKRFTKYVHKEKKIYKLDTGLSNHSKNIKSGPELEISDARLKAFGIKPKIFKNKRKFCTN